MSQTLEQLYAHYEIINDEKNESDKRIETFKSIIKGLDGDDKCKRLSSQFIAKFFKHFPDQQQEAFAKFLDIFDEGNSDTRKQAVHDLRVIGRHCKEFIPKITGVYSQLIQGEDQSEYLLASQALSEFLLSDPKVVLEVILSQMVDDGSENSRVGLFKFLQENLKKIPETKIDEDLEEYIMGNLQKVLQDVSEIEFIPLISVMSSLKSMSNVVGRQKLVDMITQQAIQDVPEFQIDDNSAVAQIRESAKQISLYISKNVHAQEMLEYLVEKVLPQLSTSSKSVEHDDLLSLWQVIAALSNHGGPKWIPKEENLDKYLEGIMASLNKLLPAKDALSDTEDKTKLEIDYTLMECVLFTLLNIGKNHSSSEKFTSENWTQIKTRLQVLARSAQDYHYTLKVKENEQVDAKFKVLIQKTMANILEMVKAFFKNPISFKISEELDLSWRQLTETNSAAGRKSDPKSGEKRSSDANKGNNTRDNWKRGRRQGNGGRGGGRNNNRRY